MTTLVIGGSASGKSAFAETLLMHSKGTHRLYIATMEPFGDESRSRIEKHQTMRRNKGFDTIECYRNIKGLVLPPQSVILLECVGNLLANELFSPAGAGYEAAAEIKQGILSLSKQATDFIIVTNDVFSDGRVYDEATERYKWLLAQLNQWLAAQAEAVYEVVCGIPLVCKKSV